MTASISGSGMPVLYYIRHGETDWNVEQRLQGHRDTPLNARGRRQASHCGDILRDLLVRDGRAAVDCAYVSSPLCRARETMQLVRTAVDLEPDIYDVDKRLIEISFGDWEGLTLPEIAGRDAEALAAREQNKWGFTPPGGEVLPRRDGACQRLVCDGDTGHRRHRPRRRGAGADRAFQHSAARRSRPRRYCPRRRLCVRRRDDGAVFVIGAHLRPLCLDRCCGFCGTMAY